MALPVKQSADLELIKDQFMQLHQQDFFDLEVAGSLIDHFEHSLLALVDDAKPTAELTEFLQTNLSWLNQQMERVNSEKELIAEQLIQIKRAKKGNASYDVHKSG